MTGPGFAGPVVRARALVGVVLISATAILVRLAEVSPGTAAFFRVAYAAPVLFLLGWPRRGEDARPRWARGLAFVGGLAFAVDLNLWHRSIHLIGAGLSTVLGNTQVLWVGLLAWIVLREAPARFALVTVPVALAGVALTSGLGRADAYGTSPVLGAVYGVSTGVAYAAFLLLLRASNRSRAPPAGPLLDATVGAVVGTLALAPLDPGFSFAWSWPAHGWLLVLALGAHTVGWLLITEALPKLPALETSVLLLVQPVLTMAWGALLFGEAPSPLQWLGVALVLGAVGAHGTLAARGTLRPAGAG